MAENWRTPPHPLGSPTCRDRFRRPEGLYERCPRFDAACQAPGSCAPVVFAAPRPGAPTRTPAAGGSGSSPALAFSLIATLAVLTFNPGDSGAWNAGRATANWAGPFRPRSGVGLFHAVGVSAYGVVAMILTVAVLAIAPQGRRLAPFALVGWILVGFATSALAHLIANPSHWIYPPGGALGRVVGEAARGAFSVAGSLILLGALLLMALLLATHFAVGHAFNFAARGVGHVSAGAVRQAMAAYSRRRNARLMRSGDDEEDDRIEPGPDARYPVPLQIVGDDEEEGEEEPAETALAAETAPATRPSSKPPRVVLPSIPPDKSDAAKTTPAKAKGAPEPATALTDPGAPADAAAAPKPAEAAPRRPCHHHRASGASQGGSTTEAGHRGAPRAAQADAAGGA